MLGYLLSDGDGVIVGVTDLVGDDGHVDLHESVWPGSPRGESPPARDGGHLAGVSLADVGRETDRTDGAVHRHGAAQLQDGEVVVWEVVVRMVNNLTDGGRDGLKV